MRGNYLGEIASLVLTLIAVTEKTNVVELQNSLTVILGDPPNRGMIYNTLIRLKDDGLISSERGIIERIDNRKRQVFFLEEPGQKQFDKEQNIRFALKEFVLENYGKEIH